MCIDATLVCAAPVIVRLFYKYILRETMNYGMCIGVTDACELRKVQHHRDLVRMKRPSYWSFYTARPKIPHQFVDHGSERYPQ